MDVYKEGINRIYDIWLSDGIYNTKILSKSIAKFLKNENYQPHKHNGCEFKEFKNISGSYCVKCGVVTPF